MAENFNWYLALAPTEYSLTPVELSQYFERIGLGSPSSNLEASPELLYSLVRAHTMTIPFENLDVALKETVSLAPSDIMNKLVTRRRGGYCLEMNGLLAYALRSLGYSVRLRHARVWMRHASYTPRDPPHPRQHQCLIVRCKGADASGTDDFLVDVGFGGGGPAEPLPLRTGGPPIRTAGDLFRLDSGNADEDTHILWGIQAGAWKRLYSFEHRSLDVPIAHASDFLLCNFFVQRAHGHFFITLPFASKLTAEGRLTLAQRELRRKGVEREGEAAVVDITPVRDAAHLRALFDEHFGIALDLPQAKIIFDTEHVA